MSLFSKKIFALFIVTATLMPISSAQAKSYRNAEYGFGLNFDNRFQSCKDLDWTHEHGVVIYLEPGVCTYGFNRGIVIRGDYNAAFYASAETSVQGTCDYDPQHADGKATVVQAPDGLQLGNLHSASCRIDYPDGRVYIAIDAMAGHQILGPYDTDPDDKAPILDYSFEFFTNVKSFDADLATLRSVLKSMTFFRGKCCDPQKVTGLP